MKTSKKSAISTSVMKRIKQGDVHMRPHLYFTLLFIVSLLGVVLSGFVVSYLVSIMFFWLRIQTSDTMAWGARANLSEVLSSFPWWAPLVAIMAFAAAVWLIHKHGTMYRHKTATIALIAALISLLIGFSMYTAGIGGTHSDNGDGNNQQVPRGQGWRN